MTYHRTLFSLLGAMCALASFASGQQFTLGEVTVELIQGLDSLQNPRGMSLGRVTKSTNEAIPRRSQAIAQIVSDPVKGGYTVQLIFLEIGAQKIPVASSAVELGNDVITKLREKARAPGAPEDAVSGTRVFLPERTSVRFTLTAPAQTSSANIAPSQPGAQPAPRQVLPAVPAGWISEKVPEVSDDEHDVVQQAAILNGKATHNGRTAGALLVMHCDFPTKAYPDLLPLEVTLDPQLGVQELVDTGAAVPVDVSSFASSQLGEEGSISVNAIGQNRTTGARYRFFYEYPDMNTIVNSGGKVLRLELASGTGGPPNTTAEFELPTDPALVAGVMQSCLSRAETTEQAKKAAIVTCPGKDNLVLNAVELKYADNGKEVKGDFDEMDNGASWIIPQPGKGHLPRKVLMICNYRTPQMGEGSENVASATVAVPSSAKYCEFTTHPNAVRNQAICTTNTPVQAEAVAAHAPASLPSTAQKSPAEANGKGANLPPGHTAPVNRLNVRGISVRMGRAQILAAAKAANMRVLENMATQLKLVDPTASGNPVGEDSGSGGHGLVLLINLDKDQATMVMISEQGAMKGEVFEDICKKWGKPAHLPRGYDSELGAGDKATWGDRKDIYAEYNPSIYAFGGQTVTIYDAVALAPHVAPRKQVPM